MTFLPIGYVFEPSKQELIDYYLQNRLSNQPMELPLSPIVDYDVYSKHPYDVLESIKGQTDGRSGMMEGYFFTSLKKSAKVKVGGTRKSRRIGEEETWSAKSKVTPVLDENGKVIGYHRYYKFEPFADCKDRPRNRLKWKMHEYSLKGNDDMIVCYITGEDDDRDKNNYFATSLKRPLYEDNIIGSNYEIGESSKRGRFQPHPMPLMVRQDQPNDILRHNVGSNYEIGESCKPGRFQPLLMPLMVRRDQPNDILRHNIESNYEIGETSKRARGCFQLDPMSLMVRQDQAYDFRPPDICQDQQIPISHVNENPSFDFGNERDLGFLRSIGLDILPHNICQDQQFPMTLPYEVHLAQEQDFWRRHICQDQQFPTSVNEHPSSDIDDVIKQIDFGGEVQEGVDKEKSENEALAKEIEGLVEVDDEKEEVDYELLRLLLASDGNNEPAVKDLMEGID